MDSASSEQYEFYFNEPRLRMTIVGRLIVRIVGYVTYLFAVVLAATLLLSDLTRLRTLGVLLALVLVDRLIHIREADKPLSELPLSGRVNLARYLRPRAFSAIERLFDHSVLTGRDFFLEATEHFANLPEVEEALRRLDVKPEEFRQKLDGFLEESKRVEGRERTAREELRKKIEALVVASSGRARAAGHQCIEAGDIFAVLPLVEHEFLTRLFGAFAIDPGDLDQALVFGFAKQRSFRVRRIPTVLGGFVFESQRRLRHRVMNRAWTSRPTPTLDRYGIDFTDLARQEQVGFLVGHKMEFDRLVETLARPINPNALLVGESGIGKEAIVAHLAFKLAKDDVPPALFDKRLVALELGNVVAGAGPGELQARIQRVAEEIIMAENIILYIPDIHNLVNTSGTAFLSAADALMPVIMNNAFPVIGATYPKEFRQLIEPRSDFTGAFEVVHVNEISESEAERVLIYETLLLERRYGVTISFGAIKKSVKLAKKYFRNKFLPASAEELLKTALVEAARREDKFLGPDQVVTAAESKTNVPIHETGEAESEKLLNLEKTIHDRLVDQEEAVTAVANALREYRSGLSRPGGPIASFLFVGPTGVGKTELAKILAKVQFGSEGAMVRFDMTEYQDKQSFFRFIGSPDGRVSGALTQAVLEKPYSLILLDEFEKAFPDILNLFLQVLDDGRLTDNLGRTVGFENTIIIATSNAHSDIINEALQKGQPIREIAEYLKRRLVDVFKPELLNRFSRIVIFKNLEPPHLERIVALYLQDIARAVGEQGITLSFDQAVIKRLVQLGYDPAFGARPLRRVVDEKLRVLLAEKILKKELIRGTKAKFALQGDVFSLIHEKS